MVLWLICMGKVIVKCVPWNKEMDLEYMLSTNAMVPTWYPRSSMSASSLGWSI